jgi:hypothetical protein
VQLGTAVGRLLAARTEALPVAVCRIGLGLAMLGRGLKTTRDLYLLQHDPRTVPVRLFDWAPELASLPEIALLGGVWIASAIALTIGWHARVSAATLAGCVLLVHFVDQNFWAHHMYFLGLMMLLFAWIDSDAALSVRAWRSGRAREDIDAWAVLLVKIQLSLVYFYTGVAKLNPAFLSGDVLAARVTLPDAVAGPTAYALLAVCTLAAEFFLAFGLWLAGCRILAVFAGVLLHGLVPVFMGFYAGLVVFSLATLSLYVLFFSEADLRRAVAPVLARFRLRPVSPIPPFAG